MKAVHARDDVVPNKYNELLCFDVLSRRNNLKYQNFLDGKMYLLK